MEERIARAIKISKANSGFITDRYEQLTQDLELLQAACPAVLLLGIAVLIADFRIAPALGGSITYGKTVFGALAVLIITLASFFLFLISKIRREMVELSDQASTLGTIQMPVTTRKVKAS